MFQSRLSVEQPIFQRFSTECLEKPRHSGVLAAAASAGVRVIVTYNLKDFPNSSLAPHAITAQGPSPFLMSLYDMALPAVTQTWKLKLP
jgi:hypothetical protein